MNNNLSNAKREKNDEFYTELSDIEKELKHYKEQFKNKTVFCNCDDPEQSNFWKYFKLNFNHLEIKKLVSTHFEKEKPSYKLEFDGVTVVRTNLVENGDFRSEECVNILKSADIVASNPPFSLFREYIAQLIEHDKQFIVVGSQNAITYKDIFSLIKNNKLWLGCNSGQFKFKVPESYETGNIEVSESGTKYAKLGNIAWFTNMETSVRQETLMTYREYNPIDYPKYDEYDAININKLSDIPKDYNGVMGVPITFMNKYNPKQFEIIGIDRYVEDNPHYGRRFSVKNKETYARILIKRVNQL